MPQYFQKPENALKRANEFIAIGKKEAALDVLYDVIKSKKHRNWQKIHEPILRTYLTLCVDLKRSVNAKEGLYQYKLICQQVNIVSLEEVISFFLELAEKHADDAKNQSIMQVTVEDLDQVQTPEGILLSSVSSEDAQDRSDRVLLTPWVKFLWEAYRNVLELLRNNNRVEKLYQETAKSAFRFCLKYNRRAEFRKLCTLIKNHLDQVLKYQGQPTAIDLNNPTSLQMHLETRQDFQLENAISMELWQEAFKAIEGIHFLMQISKKTKPQMMANYYEKVALVFFKAENKLFHAAALLKLFLLIKEQKKTVTPEELEKIGSKVLLSVLSIPSPPGRSSMEEYLSYDTISYDKERRLTTLLGLIAIPTRQSLTDDLESHILSHVSSELKELFVLLETKFQPLSMGKRVHEILETIKDNEELVQYIVPTHEITMMKTLKQVSQVYESITFTRLLKMLPFTNILHLERIIVSAVKEEDLQISINHQTNSLSFGSTLQVALKEEVPDGPYIQAMPSEILRSQLCSLTEGVEDAVYLINPEGLQKDLLSQRKQMVDQYLRQERKEHAQLLNRKSVIEARKEKIEHMKNAQERKEQTQMRQQREKLRIAEEQRLEVEREKREKERRLQEMKEIQKQQVWDRVESLRGTDVGKRAFKNLSAKEIDEMDPDDILQRQYEQLDREKREQILKLRTQEKRVDHLARAMRMEEIPLREKFIEDKLQKDREQWEKDEEDRIRSAEKEHQIALKTKARLSRMVDDRNVFLDKLFGNRHAEYQARLEEFENNLEKVRQERLEARKMKRIAQRRQEFILARREQKRKEKEEELKREKEREEQRQQEELERKRLEQEERQKKLEEAARKQRERELEIEAKQKQRNEEARERSDGPATSGGKYIPPSRRAAMASSVGDSWRSDDTRREDDRSGRDDQNDDRGPPDRRFDDRDRRFDDRDRRFDDRDRRVDDRDRRFDDRDRRFDDRGPPDRRFDDRGPSDRRYDDRGSDRRYDDRGPSDRRFDDRGPSDRRYDDRRGPDRRYDDRGYSDRRFDDRGASDRRYDDRDRRFDDRGPSDRRYDDRGPPDRRFDDRGSDRRYDDRDDRDRRFDDARGTRGFSDRSSMDRRDDRYSDSPRRDGFGGRSSGWRSEGRDGGSGGNWRSGDGGRSEGRSYQASRVRADRDRDDRPPPSRSGDDGWTTVRGR